MNQSKKRILGFRALRRVVDRDSIAKPESPPATSCGARPVAAMRVIGSFVGLSFRSTNWVSEGALQFPRALSPVRLCS